MVSQVQSPEPVTGIQFGFSVATDGNLAAVGAPMSQLAALNGGAIFLYQNAGNGWQRLDTTFSSATPGDMLGCAVAVRGSVLSAGACGGLGAVQVYEDIAGQWQLVTTLAPLEVEASDLFGSVVAVGDGVIAVGAPGTNNFAGAVHLFEKQPEGNWIPVAVLTAADGQPNDLFGRVVSADGTTLAVGAERHDSEGGENAGAVYIYERAGGTWGVESAKLTASDGKGFDEFGHSVALSGSELVVGARWTDARSVDAGTAYLFELRGESWIEAARLNAPDAAAGDGLGFAVAVDQETVISTAYPDLPGGNNSGSVYVFERAQ
ncbi:MAG: FG-GAP repeat protein [Myxococcota bacterium]